MQQRRAGTVRIGEVAAGRAAKELGIFTPTSAVPGAYSGRHRSRSDRAEDDAAGQFVRHQGAGRLVSTGSNNDIVLTAATTAPAWNGVTVVYATGRRRRQRKCHLRRFTKTLTVQIEDGESTANDVIAAINAEGTFTAEADRRDATSVGPGRHRHGEHQQLSAIVTAGGSGAALDTASGLILTNGGDPVTLDISTAETVEDLFNLITGADVGLSADDQRRRQRHQRPLRAQRCRFHDRRKRRHDRHAAWHPHLHRHRRSWPTSIAASACRQPT